MSLALRTEIVPLPILVIEQQTLLDQKHILLVVFTIEVMASMTEGKRQLSCLATKVIAIQCELANNHLNKFSYVSDAQGKKRHTIKSYFTYGSVFQSRYFNVEGRKTTELEIALFSKQRTHNVDTFQKVYVLEDSRLWEVKLY